MCADTPLPAHIRQRGDRDPDSPAPKYAPAPEPLAIPVYDNHAHLEFADGDNPMDYRDHLARSEAVGVKGVVQVGTDVETSQWSAELASRDARVLAAIALHPNEAPLLIEDGGFDGAMVSLEELASAPRVVAVGETGLDFYRTEEPLHDAQRQSFIEHIRLAKKYDLALQIHDRDAHHEVVRILREEGAPERTVFHCYSGDAELAEVLRQNGWYASFAGTVTFKNGEGLRDALRVMPRSHILVETDTPFLTPTPFRGKPNSPYMIPYTLRFMAEVLESDVDEVCEAIARNTETVYGSWSHGA